MPNAVPPTFPVATDDFDDTLNGVGGDDTLNGLGGDDRLEGGADDDTLNGGDGTDTAVYTTGVDPSEITFVGSSWVVTAEGTDTLNDVEVIDGSTFRLVGGGGYATIQEAIDDPIPAIPSSWRRGRMPRTSSSTWWI